MPVQRASLGGRRVADQVIGQLKRSSGGLIGAMQKTAGVVFGVALAIVGIPVVVFGLVRLISISFWWLPVVLVLWFTGVVLLVMRALSPRATPSPYRHALVRLADLSYCTDCDVIFENARGRIVPVAELRDVLYADSEDVDVEGAITGL